MKKVSQKVILPLLLSLGLFFSQFSVAQTIQISGKVLSAKDNAPLENVTVRPSGTRQGTSTKADGSFKIEISKGQSLEFSSVNMISKTVKSISQATTSLMIVLEEADNNLSEVMVVAYGTQKRSSVTGSSATVKPTVLENSPRTSVQESLQGNIAGLQSQNGSGQPGSVPNIRIRGIGSISAGATPLYVIDGIPVVSGDISGGNSNTIAGLNPNDIQTLTVLKDASATSLYGSRAANGVVLITTKNGKPGKAKINISVQQGMTNNTLREEQKTLNTDEYIQYYQEGWVNAGRNPASYDSALLANGVNKAINTDWFKAVMRQGKFSQYNLSASGGNDKSTFYMSGSYYTSEAPIKSINYDRATYRINASADLTARWNLKGGFSGNYQRSSDFATGSFFENPTRAMYRLVPWLPIYKSDGVTWELGYNSGYNPVAVLATTKRVARTYNIGANASSKYKLLKGLTFESSFALDFNHAFRTLNNDPRVGNAYVAVGGSVQNFSQDIVNWIATNIVRYKTEFGRGHEIEAFGGYEAQSRSDMDMTVRVNGVTPGTSTPAGGSQIVTATGTATRNTLVSQFMNANYGYLDKYFLTGSIRQDASSRFAKNYQSAIFWSVGFGWNISNEPFMKSKWVSELKLRGSYGYTGNQGIDNFVSQGLYTAGSDYNQFSGITLSQLANDNLTWEKNIPLDLGIDFSLFKGRFTGNVDWYSRVSSNLLIDQSIPSLNGVTSMTINSGAMKNSGVEVAISTVNIAPKKQKGFKWVTDFNVTTNKNVITQIDSLFSNNGDYFRRVGYDYYTHYQRAYAGVNPANGEALWYTSSAKDSTTNVWTTSLPRMTCGSALPKFFGGITNSMSFGDFKLSFQLYVFWGNRIYDANGYLQKTDANLGFTDQSNGLSKYEYRRRWTKPGDITDVPKPVFLGTQSSAGAYESTRFNYDGSYIRLRDVSLTYSVPKQYLAKSKMNSMRVYVRGQNLFTYVKDKRFNTDPETDISGTLNQNPPIYSTLLFGIDISF